MKTHRFQTSPLLVSSAHREIANSFLDSFGAAKNIMGSNECTIANLRFVNSIIGNCCSDCSRKHQEMMMLLHSSAYIRINALKRSCSRMMQLVLR